MATHKSKTIAPPADPLIINKARDTLREMEQHVIMMQLGTVFTSEHYKTRKPVELEGVSITPNKRRDELFMQKVAKEVKRLHKLLNRPEGDIYITKKRLYACRQRAFVLNYKNRNANVARSNWADKHSSWLAGTFLLAIFNKHLWYRPLDGVELWEKDRPNGI